MNCSITIYSLSEGLSYVIVILNPETLSEYKFIAIYI